MLWVIEPWQEMLLGKALLHELLKREPLCVIDNPTALANTLPTLINMIEDGWVVEVEKKERVRYRGEELAWELVGWFRFVVIINGITTSVLLYRSA